MKVMNITNLCCLKWTRYIYKTSYAAHGINALYLVKVWRVPLLGDQCGDAESVDIANQPKDLSLALLSPDLALVSYETGVTLLRGTKVVSTIDLGFTVTACAIAPNGNEAVVGGQDGKLHVYSVLGDTLKEEAVLEKHRGPITVIQYSPDVSMFASADSNREATVWDRVSHEVPYRNIYGLKVLKLNTSNFRWKLLNRYQKI